MTTYPRPQPPDDLAPPAPPYSRPDDWAAWLKAAAERTCAAISPAWGWEGEGEQCQRRPHADPWHYSAERGEHELWWRAVP